MRAVEAGRACLALLALAGLALPWLSVAPNRLLPGTPVIGIAALGAMGALAALALLVAVPRRVPAGLAALLAMAGVAVLLAATGQAAAVVMTDLPSAARAGLGGGFWLALVAGTGLFASRVAGLPALWQAALVLAGCLLVMLLWRAGLFEALSLLVEYRAREAAVRAALLRHLALAGAALGLALLIALPLAWAGFVRPRAAGAVGAALGAVQVVPAIALFAILIPLLAALLAALPALRGLGLGAIGPAPAVLATALYLALPLWRAVLGGLTAADPAAVAAAQALGMGEGRITFEIRLPLALPVFAGGLRVAVVQAVGLMTLGGLVGAGGLGTLVFQGLAQFATDLMLLGALPVIVLALLADAATRGLERALAVGA